MAIECNESELLPTQCTEMYPNVIKMYLSTKIFQYFAEMFTFLMFLIFSKCPISENLT